MQNFDINQNQNSSTQSYAEEILRRELQMHESRADAIRTFLRERSGNASVGNRSTQGTQTQGRQTRAARGGQARGSALDVIGGIFADRNPHTVADLIRRSKFSDGSVRNALRALQERGTIVKSGDGWAHSENNRGVSSEPQLSMQ